MGIICDTCGRDIDALGQDKCRLWLGCCEPKETAAPAAGGAAQEAAAPCLKEEGFATLGQDAMHKVAEPMLRMAVE